MVIEDGVLKKVHEEDIIDGKVIIPEGVTEIGESAFEWCESLTEIKIPEGVTEIGKSAFAWCKSLTEIKIPEGVTSIGEEAFRGCRSLTEIKIPEGVTEIGEYAFSNCGSLTEIKIPEVVTKIGNGAFYGCRSLTEIKIPEVVTSIGEDAFRACSSLTEINIPEGVTEIGGVAFSGCSSLTEIKIPEGVTKIGSDAFSDCSSLTEIKIPEGVTEIGDGAFAQCSSLTKVELPKEINENLLEQLYKKEVPIDPQLMFGNDLERFYKIKENVPFSKALDYDYDEKTMNIFYHRMINSIGIDEVEKMLDVGALTQEEIEKYSLEKDDAFKQLYDVKYKIEGDFGTTLDIFRALNLSKYKSEETNKNSAEMNIFKEINKMLEDGNQYTLRELVSNTLRKNGYDLTQEQLEKIQELETSVNGKFIDNGLNNIKDLIEQSLYGTGEEEPIAQRQIEPIRKMIEDEIRKTFKETGKIESGQIQERLHNKLTNANADYIIQKADSIVQRTMRVLNDEEINKQINHSAVDALRQTKEKIGKGWKYKINLALNDAGYTMDNLPQYLSAEAIEKIQESIGIKAEEGIELQTSVSAQLKEGEEKKKAYGLLMQEGLPNIVTYKQIHDMFGSVHEPYSEKFKEYFSKHKEEFLQNPENIEEFGRIHNNFEELIKTNELENLYKQGKLEIKDILGYLETIEFENQRPGEEELAKLASSVGQISNDEEYEEVQKVFDIVKRRERTSIPPIHVKEGKYTGRMLSPDDVLNMFAGNITTCCQRFGDVGEGAMRLGSIEENAGIFVVEKIDENGKPKIVGQSLTIRQKGINGENDRLCFDNIEIPDRVKGEMSKEDHAQILEIYKQAGKRAIIQDEKYLKSLLEQGKITKETYEGLVLKEVTVGTGYNDLEGLTNNKKAQNVIPDEAYYNYNTRREKVQPWIDSAKGVPSGSQRSSVIIAENENARTEINTGKKAKLQDVPLWYGTIGKIREYKENLPTEAIEEIKEIEKHTYREGQQILNNDGVEEKYDIEDLYNIEEPSIKIGSNKDWYLIYENGEEKLTISDLAIEGTANAEDNGRTKTGNIKLATAEAVNTLYELMLEAGRSNKTIYCNATKDTSLVNIKRMLKKGIIKRLEDGQGKELMLDERGKLVDTNQGKEPTYRDFGYDSGIEMLDLEIEVDTEKLAKEQEKTKALLSKISEQIIMEGKEKEEGLDELRRKMRKDLNNDDER